MGDITKLPKWAQQHIRVLESNVEHWKTLATAGPENSNTFLHHWKEGTRPLGDSPSIRFVVPGGDVNHHRDVFQARIVEDSIDGALLEVRADRMAVMPSVTNVVYIKLGGRG